MPSVPTSPDASPIVAPDDKPSDSSPVAAPVGAFFRCPVQPENSQALIRIGRRRLIASVAEQSIDGFTVTMNARTACRLKVGRPWVLEYDKTRIEVHPQWMFNSPTGDVQLGLRRLRDLTCPDRPVRKRSILSRCAGRQYDDPSHSAIVFGGFVLGLFALLSLPGLGDHLGTSDRIEGALKWVIAELNQSFGRNFPFS